MRRKICKTKTQLRRQLDIIILQGHSPESNIDFYISKVANKKSKSVESIQVIILRANQLKYMNDTIKKSFQDHVFVAICDSQKLE